MFRIFFFCGNEIHYMKLKCPPIYMHMFSNDLLAKFNADLFFCEAIRNQSFAINLKSILFT